MTELSSTIREAIQQIHDSPPKLVFEFAGAGSLALFWLHSVAGSSRTVLEATDRYAPASMLELLGAPPEKFVSRATAEAMALAAFRRAKRLADAETPCLGVGCTATIATDRTKRGDHEVWIAVQDRAGVQSYGIVITKGARDRLGEERLVGQLLIRALAAACGSGTVPPLDLLGDEQLQQAATSHPDALTLLLDSQAHSVTVHANGQRLADEPVQGGLLSGSFNPLHAGHERLAQAAAQIIGQPVLFELPVLNADKPPLSYAELERRLAQFRARYDVVLSRAPLFVDKATLYPGCVFVVGYDTAVRLVDPRYYNGSAGRDAALAHIAERGCRLLVAGRVQGDTFLTLDAVAVPEQFRALFSAIPESAFRLDLSSTQLRAALAQEPGK